MLLLELQAKGVRKDSINRVKRIIGLFLGSIRQYNGVYVFTVDELMNHLAKIKETYSKEYYRKHVVYIKKLLKIARVEIYELLKAKKARTPDKTIVTVNDIKSLLDIYEKLYKRNRLEEKKFDQLRLVTLLLATTGMRVFELSRLRIRDIDIENRTIYLSPEITKSGEGRVAFFTEEVQKLLADYILKYKLKPSDGIATVPQMQRPFRHKRELRKQKLRLKHMRKFFSQEWDRRNGNTTVKKMLMGHSITDDINALHYSHHTPEELKEIYDKIMGDLKFLT